jgi:hypothetical protein
MRAGPWGEEIGDLMNCDADLDEGTEGTEGTVLAGVA